MKPIYRISYPIKKNFKKKKEKKSKPRSEKETSTISPKWKTTKTQNNHHPQNQAIVFNQIIKKNK